MRILLLLLQLCILEASVKWNLTDPNKCKVTSKGTEFMGTVYETPSGRTCQSWTVVKPVHKPLESVTDDKFPEGSKAAAWNFCRNPTTEESGPWCYTLDPKVRFEYCDVPFCKFTDCIITGAGSEYVGSMNHTVSGYPCDSWATSASGSILDSSFPDGSKAAAGHFCRNPDADNIGPWCYVNKHGLKFESCDIPYCDNADCMVLSASVYDAYTFIHLRDGFYLRFSVKLFSPKDTSDRAILIFSAHPVQKEPVFEIELGHDSSIRSERRGKILTEGVTPGLLSSTGWAHLWVKFRGGVLQMGRQGDRKPFLGYANEEGLEPHYVTFTVPEGGNPVMWNTSCDKVCDVFVTTNTKHGLWIKLRRSNGSLGVWFSVRAHRQITVLFRGSPVTNKRACEVTLNSHDLRSSLTCYNNKAEKGTPVTDKMPKIFSTDTWIDINISIHDDKLTVFANDTKILSNNFGEVRSLRWFSVGSPNVAYWTFFCRPEGKENKISTDFPECKLTEEGREYIGSQSVTLTGKVCLPWTSKRVKKTTENDFPDTSKLAARNYCRRVDPGPSGLWCYVQGSSGEATAEKCLVRNCSSKDCKLSGIGRDFSGNQSVTQSNRSCRRWIEAGGNSEELGEEHNFCRNPGSKLDGPWCYTTDTKVPIDVCNVRDCWYPGDCIVLTKESNFSYGSFLTPAQKTDRLNVTVKSWNPDDPLSVSIILTQAEQSELSTYYRIDVRSDRKVLLHYKPHDGEMRLVKEGKLAGLVRGSQWITLWVKVKLTGFEVGLGEEEHSLMEWTTVQPTFTPSMFMISSEVPIGWKQTCGECTTVMTKSDEFTVFSPIGIVGNGSAIVVQMLGNGTGHLGLFHMVHRPTRYIRLSFNLGVSVNLTKRVGDNLTELSEPTMPAEGWNKYLIKYNEKKLEIFFDDGKKLYPVLSWNSTDNPILVYWISFSSSSIIYWSLNCEEPPDLNEATVHGGWSEWGSWRCSVSCGGGYGTRTRSCTSPPPSLFGDICFGESEDRGRCNAQVCGDISVETILAVRRSVGKEQVTLAGAVGKSVTLSCNRKLLDVIDLEIPSGTLLWFKNDAALRLDPDRMQMDDEDVYISSLQSEDSGVYACLVEPPSGDRYTLNIISLVVLSKKPSLFINKGRKLRLSCQSNFIVRIFGSAQQQWMFEDTLWKTDDVNMKAMSVNLTVAPVKKAHEGVWECIVVQPNYNLSWRTNWVKLKVYRGPSFFRSVMKDPVIIKTLKRFSGRTSIIAVSIVVPTVVLLIVVTCCHVYVSHEEQKAANILRLLWVYGYITDESESEEEENGEKKKKKRVKLKSIMKKRKFFGSCKT